MTEAKQYSIIYADPPWQYNVWRNTDAGRTAASHYQTMSLDNLCSLPISTLASPDCTLFMWVTLPLLFDSIKVIQAWGFQYKTIAFVWIKTNKKSDSLFWGMGHWTRANAELCILATKGHPRRQAANVHQVILSRIREHSQKPDEARERIVQLMGDLPRIELFARERTSGWDVWGNEVESDISLITETNGTEQHIKNQESEVTQNGICDRTQRPEQSQIKGSF